MKDFPERWSPSLKPYPLMYGTKTTKYITLILLYDNFSCHNIIINYLPGKTAQKAILELHKPIVKANQRQGCPIDIP